MTSAAEIFETSIQKTMGKVVFGVDDIIHGLTIAIIAQGHVLIEGVPGLGKTLIAKSIAASIGGNFKRIQCTADLMPSDMTGIHIFNSQSNNFELAKGPLFSDIVLVDEINRTSPRTQSALLQAMEEKAITIDNDTYNLSDNFFVIASQNPHDFEGTYPLPESQLDRFLLLLTIDYLSPEHEKDVLRTYDNPGGGHSQDIKLDSSSFLSQLDQVQEQVKQVHVSESIYDYITQIAINSRQHSNISLGLSTRGALALMRCARIEAALQGSGFVTPDDVKTVAPSVMAHRLILSPDANLEGIEPNDLVKTILDQVTVPRE